MGHCGTAGDALRSVARGFAAGGVPTPGLDARLLVGHAAALSDEDMIAAPETPLKTSAQTHLRSFAERRLAGESVARIIGRRAFHAITLNLAPGVFEPRADSECLVDAALALKLPKNPRILDIGTGTGALLLALLHARPDASGIGTDCAPEALRCAKANAEALGLAPRAQFIRTSWMTMAADAIDAQFDVIVSNPPYIPTDALATLAPEIRHDPHLALDGGADGLCAVKKLLPSVLPLMRPNARFLVEIGLGQAHSVARLLARDGLYLRARRRDLNGFVRVLIASA